jgi:Uma2 family endonuclease
VLDEHAALVVQPDLVFVSRNRAHIIRDRVWGAPDLVVEVLSRRTATHDRTNKLEWYRHYGVRECWLTDPALKSVEVVDCLRPPSAERRIHTGHMPVRSRVFAELSTHAEAFFE